ncbi:MAG: carbon storage regulator [Gemmatimonadales bacterium]|jgi:carbon storage regulator|nr:carbon storage regulator [Gemmatimonadales bacterium]
MLVLNRRPGEAIILDGGIRVVVLSSDKRGTRLGIEAPPTTGILREELVKQVASENVRAASTGDHAASWAAQLPLRASGGDAGGGGAAPER